MTSALVISFDGVDEALASAATGLLRLLPVLAAGELESCDLGADRATRRIRVQPLFRGAPTEQILRRITFWSARAGGRAEGSAGPDAERRWRELHGCELVARSAGPLRLVGVVRTAFPAPPGALAPPALAATLPILALELGGPGLGGVTYDRRTRSLFVPSPLSPPVEDSFVLEISEPATRAAPVRAGVRVTDSADASAALAGRPPGFAVRLLAPGGADELLARHCPPPVSGAPCRAQRYRVVGQVRVRPVCGELDGDAAPAAASYVAIRDLSASGALIRGGDGWALEERLEIEGVLPNRGELRATATVVRHAEDGVGLRFDDAPTPDLAAAITELSGRPRRALVIDDDALSRAMLSDVFLAHGYDVLTAPDATEGFRILTDQLFAIDLLVTDVLMAGLDGEQLVHVIRRLGGESDLPIVVVTSSTDPDLTLRLRRMGADAVVPKSAGPQAAFVRANTLVDERHGRAAPAQAESA